MTRVKEAWDVKGSGFLWETAHMFHEERSHNEGIPGVENGQLGSHSEEGT